MALTPLGVLLLVAGLVIGGPGAAGRIKATQMLGPGGSTHPFKSRNPIYEAKRLYELPDHGLRVRSRLDSGNRLILSGATLCVVGIVLIL